jgi:hypothetical protein
MSIINLPFTLTAPDPRVPVVIDFAAAIPALPGIWSWHSVRQGAITLDANGNIDTLIDRTPNGRTIGGTPIGLHPAVVADAVNGKSAASFDGTDGLLYLSSHPTTAYSNLIVFRAPASTTDQTIFGQSTSVGINHRIWFQANSMALRHQAQNAALVSGDTNISAGNVVPDAWNVVVATFDGATGSVKVKLNDLPVVTATKAGLTAIQDIQNLLGCGNTPGGVPSSAFKGRLADLIVMSNDVLATPQASSLALLRKYFAAAYGLAI